MSQEGESTKQSNYHFIFVKSTMMRDSKANLRTLQLLHHSFLPSFAHLAAQYMNIYIQTFCNFKNCIQHGHKAINRNILHRHHKIIRFKSATSIKPWFELSKGSFYLVCPSNFPILTLRIEIFMESIMASPRVRPPDCRQFLTPANLQNTTKIIDQPN